MYQHNIGKITCHFKPHDHDEMMNLNLLTPSRPRTVLAHRRPPTSAARATLGRTNLTFFFLCCSVSKRNNLYPFHLRNKIFFSHNK